MIDEKNPWRKDQKTFKMLWHYCSQPRALRNPRRIKRILRRILHYKFDEEKLKRVPQSELAQNLLFLVILSDLWPEAYEFYMTTSHKSWRAWLDYMADPKDVPQADWILTNDRDLQGFLHEVMKYNNRTFDNTVIGNQKELSYYLKDVGDFGL